MQYHNHRQGKKSRRGKNLSTNKRQGNLRPMSALARGRGERGGIWRRRNKKRNSWKKKKKTRKYVPRKIEKRLSRWRRKKGQIRVKTYSGRKQENERLQGTHRRIKGKQRRRRKPRRGPRSPRQKFLKRKKRWLKLKNLRRLWWHQNKRRFGMGTEETMESLSKQNVGGEDSVQNKNAERVLKLRKQRKQMSLNSEKKAMSSQMYAITTAYQMEKKKRRRVRSVSDVSGEAHNGCRGKGKRRL